MLFQSNQTCHQNKQNGKINVKQDFSTPLSYKQSKKLNNHCKNSQKILTKQRPSLKKERHK